MKNGAMINYLGMSIDFAHSGEARITMTVFTNLAVNRAKSRIEQNRIEGEVSYDSYYTHLHCLTIMITQPSE